MANSLARARVKSKGAISVLRTLGLKLGVEEVVGLGGDELVTAASKTGHHRVENESLGTCHREPGEIV